LIRKTKDPRITAHRSRATWLARSGYEPAVFLTKHVSIPAPSRTKGLG